MDLCTFRTAEARERYRVYLVERDPQRARLLELDARRGDARTEESEALEAEMRALLESVDAEWFAALRRRLDKQLFNCGRGDAATPAASSPDPKVRFRLLCPQGWDLLERTEDARVRFCGECEQAVHACETSAEVSAHARAGHCVAVPSELVTGEVQSRTHRMLGMPDGLGMWADDLFAADGLGGDFRS